MAMPTVNRSPLPRDVFNVSVFYTDVFYCCGNGEHKTLLLQKKVGLFKVLAVLPGTVGVASGTVGVLPGT